MKKEQNRTRPHKCGRAAQRLDLSAINNSRDPELKVFFRKAVESEFGNMLHIPTKSQFQAAMDRATLTVAHKYSHLLSPDQQALLAQTPIPPQPMASPSAA